MKYIKARKDLVFILNPLLLLSGILLFCFFPHAIVAFFYSFWFYTACALFLIVTPFGNKRLAHNAENATQRLPWQRWFFCILLLELALIGVYGGIAFLNGDLFPINTPVNTHLFSESLRTELLHEGLFPWTLYALIAVGMGVVAYCEQTDAYFSALIKVFTKQEPRGTISVIINTSARRCTQFAVSITLMFMTLLFISLFLPLPLHVAHGFQTIALISTLILLFAAYSKKAKEYSDRIFSRRFPTALSFPVFCVILGFIMLILTVIVAKLTQNSSTQAMPDIIKRWIEYNHSTAWSIFSALWWICLTPSVCSFITRVSKGYKIRHILLGVLALPAAIAFCFIFSNTVHFSAITFSLMAIKIISLVSFLILLPLLVNNTHISNAILAYFPKNGIGKTRDQQPFFRAIVQFCILSLYFYLVIGMNGLSLFLFAPNYTILVGLLFVVCAIIKNIFDAN